MASRKSIIAANKAVATRGSGVPQASGAWGNGAAAMANSSGTGGNYNSGWAAAYGQPSPGLMRPPATFTDGAFAPLDPILPVPVNTPPEGSEYPEPRFFETEVGWNLPVGQPGSEGVKLADFSTLKTLADLYSVARACIQLRKNEIRGIEWDILPTRDASKAMRNAPHLARSFGARRSEAIQFFKRPDPDYFSWASFLDALSEEVFVYDALSILIRPKWAKGRGAGLLGSDLDSISLISGPTIRPLLDVHGGRPRPPAPAYQQYLYGVPRVDLMSMITERDLENGRLNGSEMGQFKADQLLYLPMTPRRWTPYGFPPIERALIPVMAGLQKQGYQLDYFREGTVPAVYISPGGVNSSMTPNQIRELQDALNALAGDPAWKHKIIVLPADSKVMPQKQVELADQFDEIVMNQVCMAFDVQPMELGIMPKVSTTVSPGASNQMSKASQSIHQRKATKPFLSFIADIMNTLLQEVAGQTDMRFMFEGLEEGEDEEVKTNILISQVGASLRSIDEAREELDLQPWGLPETSDPGWATATGWTPLTEAVAAMRSGADEGNVFVESPVQDSMGNGAPSGDAGAAGAAADAATPGSPTAPGSPEDASPTAGVAVPGAQTQPATPGHAAAIAATPQALGVPTAMAGKAKKDAPHQKFRDRREEAVQKHSDKVQSQLEEVVDKVRSGQYDRNAAVGVGVALMAAGYSSAIKQAIDHATDDHGGDFPSLASDQLIWALGEEQRPFIDGLVHTAAKKPDKNLTARLAHYADSLTATYNKAYVEVIKSNGKDYTVTWRLGDGDGCDNCQELDGQEFSLDQLPGVPGEKGFNGDLCKGGPKCRCSLEFEEAKPKDTSFKPLDEENHLRMAPDDVRQRVADLANAQAAGQGKRPAQLIQPEDVDETDISRIFASKTRAILSELESMARHVKKGRTVSDWEPRHLSADVLARVNEFMAKGADVDQAIEMIRQQRVVDSAGQVFWRDLLGDWEPGTSQGVHGGYEKKPHDVNDMQFQPKGATDLDDPNPVAAEHVYNMMLDKFPPKAIKWMRDATWIGPIEVPLERVDTDDIDGWAASHEPEKVAKFVKLLKKGKRLKPGVSVRQTEGDSRIKIVDGHHRYLASLKAEVPFVTYIGFVTEGDDRWEQTHSSQETSPAVKGLVDAREFTEKEIKPAIKGPGDFGGGARGGLADGSGPGVPLASPTAPLQPATDPAAVQTEEGAMVDPTLIEFFETGAGASQIKWGTTGDISRCVTLATQTLGLENAQTFCQVRYSKMTGQTPSGLIHSAG